MADTAAKSRFGFHQEEGIRRFKRALDHDPTCLMAASTALATTHIAQARACYGQATTLEIELVEALACRFQQPHPVTREEYARWDDDYAAALRRVHFAHPDDLDVAALLAEALITRTPRRLWDVKTGRPARNSDVLEALAICESAIALAEARGWAPHPAILHLHIHIMEMSNEPVRAMRSADLLGELCPDAGHLNHMPGHIYALCGAYARARSASVKAIAADDKFADYDRGLDFYLTALCHDLHLLMSVCMFLGQYEPAREASQKLRRLITREVVALQERPKFAMTTEGYYSMHMHVLVRFGRWHDIVAEPMPAEPDLYPVTTAMLHYAKGVAYATLKRIAEAEEERRKFAEKMLDGELAYRKGNVEEAFGHLRESVRRDDDLGYTEPWAWMHPPRHALAALLAEQERYEEAEAVYRDDLGLSGRIQRCTQHPDNVWSLHGLAECLERRGETTELPTIRHKLTAALAMADVPITSSCLCRLSTQPQQSCCVE